MSIKHNLPCVIVPAASHMKSPSSSSQQPTLQHQQKPSSTPPFRPMREQQDQYDPQNNWQVSRKRTYELPNQSSHADKVRKLSNINDLITNEERKDTKKCLVVQKSRENEFNPENPRFVTNLRYALKTEFNSFRIADKVKIQNNATGEEFVAKAVNYPSYQTSHSMTTSTYGELRIGVMNKEPIWLEIISWMYMQTFPTPQ